MSIPTQFDDELASEIIAHVDAVKGPTARIKDFQEFAFLFCEALKRMRAKPRRGTGFDVAKAMWCAKFNTTPWCDDNIALARATYVRRFVSPTEDSCKDEWFLPMALVVQGGGGPHGRGPVRYHVSGVDGAIPKGYRIVGCVAGDDSVMDQRIAYPGGGAGPRYPGAHTRTCSNTATWPSGLPRWWREGGGSGGGGMAAPSRGVTAVSPAGAGSGASVASSASLSDVSAASGSGVSAASSEDDEAAAEALAARFATLPAITGAADELYTRLARHQVPTATPKAAPSSRKTAVAIALPRSGGVYRSRRQ